MLQAGSWPPLRSCSRLPARLSLRSSLDPSASKTDGLSFGELVRDLRHDPASIVGYIFIGIFIGVVWLGMRPGRTRG